MDITAFNAATAEEAANLVRTCAAIDPWVDAVVDGRPYESADSLIGLAIGLAIGWNGTDLDAALADHPRIGERHRGDGASAALSRHEQSSVEQTGAARLADGNARYERTFDRIFLVRAAGRTSSEILDLLEQRLGHDPETEVAVTLGQLREIAALRLKGLFS